jgi:hypothetical protein
VEVQEVVRELSRYMAPDSQKHIRSMHRTMTYLLQTEKEVSYFSQVLFGMIIPILNLGLKDV